MGAGASSQTTPSSLNRLRKALVMRSYNIRKSDETLDELFKPHSYRASNGAYISVATIKSTLSEDAPWIDLLFEQMVGKDVGDLEFHSFIHFLETGNKPITMDTNVKNSTNTTKQSLLNKHNLKVRPPSDLPPSKKKGNLPPTPPRKKTPSASSTSTSTRSTNMSKCIPTFNHLTSSIYPGVIESTHLHTLPVGIHSGALVPSTGLTVALDHQAAHRNPNSGPTKPLWRKREVVTQERTVEYTTIDANGVTQELTEKEVTTTEVLHMECRETGEFAHRETTNYAQTETFNDELVAEEKGNEEYVHMKSVDDEYEFLDSNMPKKETPPEPEPDTPHTGAPFTPGSGGHGGEFDEEYRADGKETPMQNTPMHDLSVSDDEGENRRYGDMQDSSPNSTEHNSRGHFRRGGSGNSSSNKFDDSSKDEYDSPARGTPGGGGGGLWQSMGGGGGWVPPAGTDYESELLNDHLSGEFHNASPPINSQTQESKHSTSHPDASSQRPPVGVRRPDLFAPVHEDKASSSSTPTDHLADEEDINSEDGQGGHLQEEEGIESRFHSTDDLMSPRDDRRSSRENSRPTSRQGSRRSSRDCDRDRDAHYTPRRNDAYDPSLDQTEDTLNSNMFRSDSQEPDDHSPMFKPDPSSDADETGIRHVDDLGNQMNMAPSKDYDLEHADQDIRFINTETSGCASLSAKWGSEDDID